MRVRVLPGQAGWVNSGSQETHTAPISSPLTKLMKAKGVKLAKFYMTPPAPPTPRILLSFPRPGSKKQDKDTHGVCAGGQQGGAKRLSLPRGTEMRPGRRAASPAGLTCFAGRETQKDKGRPGNQRAVRSFGCGRAVTSISSLQSHSSAGGAARW